MKQKHFAVALLFIGMLIMVSPVHAAEQIGEMKSPIGDYVIGTGDVLNIFVWDNEALSRAVTVLPDGKIHFPLIGEIVVGGKTLAVLEKELKNRINPFVPNPELSVMVVVLASILVSPSQLVKAGC